MKKSGKVLTLNLTAIQTVLNTFKQNVVSTGLIAGDNRALLMLGMQVEWDISLGMNASREAALVRASKVAMPTILDDDLMVKLGEKSTMTTSGAIIADNCPFVSMPPNSIIVVEPQIYLSLVTTGYASMQGVSALMWFEEVELTDGEKNAILSSRLNNLLA